MKLVLEVTSDERHLLGENARKCFDSVGGVIGRSPSCDWVIPDSKRHLSGQHAVISCDDGAFNITDVSTNGVFINGSEQPLGRDVTVMLSQLDRISMGNIDFVARIRLGADDLPFKDWSSSSSSEEPSSLGSTAKQVDPIALFKANHGLFDDSDPILPKSGVKADIGEFMVSHFSKDEQVVSAPDHLPGINTAFDPPKMLPEDWLNESSPSDKGDDREPVSEITQIAATVKQNTMKKHDASQQNHDQQLLSQFFKGLGVSQNFLGEVDGPQIMEVLGASLRANFEGMVGLMQQRAELKNEFRMGMTLVKTQGNNPLKFSVDSKQAIKFLLQQENCSFLTMDDAFSECYRDMQLHQVALLAGVQVAIREMFKALGPDAIMSKVEGDRTGITMVSKAARCWGRYHALYRELTQEDDLFNQLFGSSFVNAYEAQLQKLGAVEEGKS